MPLTAGLTSVPLVLGSTEALFVSLCNLTTNLSQHCLVMIRKVDISFIVIWMACRVTSESPGERRSSALRMILMKPGSKISLRDGAAIESYAPELVESSAENLTGCVDRATFILAKAELELVLFSELPTLVIYLQEKKLQLSRNP